MDQVTDRLSQLKVIFPSNLDEFKNCVTLLKEKIPTSYNELEPYINSIKSISKDDIINDFSKLKLTPVTISVSITAFTTLLVLGTLITTSSNKSKSKSSKKNQKKRQKKKLSKAQKANQDIQSILDFVEGEYVPQIDEYLESYKNLKKEDIEYKYNYFEEMLLKELMKLDGIEVVANDILRENRKKVIKFIQEHQKRLDKFKKETKF